MANRWSQSHIDYLRAKAGKETPTTIATVLGRTEKSVNSYARKHGIGLAVVRKRWTREQDEAVRAGVKNGVAVRNIAEELGRTAKAVCHRIDAMRMGND